LEVGSGTGFLSREVLSHFAPSRFTINDITPQMEAFVPEVEGVEFICADAESYPFEGGYDLIVSSSAMQWFSAPEAFVQRMARALKPGGVLALSSFGMGNFKELTSLVGAAIDYHSADGYRAMFGPEFESLTIEESHLTLHFPTTRELLAHLKLTGVNGGLSREPLSITQLKRLVEEYDAKYRSSRGVPITYNPIYMVGKRR
ncbi:MAG: malonyl-ACP O-methyltransferase, partial [Rikenellaceae bacterium]